MKQISGTKNKITWVLTVLVGAVLYGSLNTLLSHVLIPGAEIISLRPQLVIPVTVSLLLGPIPGGLIGLLGNFFGDLLSGYGFSYWHWSLANFLIGFFPGMVRWFNIRSIKKVNEFGWVLIFIVLGNLAGLFEGFWIHHLLYREYSIRSILYEWYLPAVISNTFLLMLLMPPILVICRYLKMNIETRIMFYVLLFSILIISFYMIFSLAIDFQLIDNNRNGGRELFSKMLITKIRWLGILLILIVLAGGFLGFFFSKKYMQPLNLVVEAANRLKTGAWVEGSRIEVSRATDDMNNLISVFNSMATEIHQREVLMKTAIRELEMKIDTAREEKLVSEITETEFFRNLEQKSKQLKQNRLKD